MVEMKDRFSEEEETPSAIEWVFAVLKRWKIAALVFVISISFSAYYIYFEIKEQTPTYTSSALIMLGPMTLEVKTKGGEKIKQKYSISSEVALIESDIIAKRSATVLKEKFGYEDSLDNLIPEIKKATYVTAEEEREKANTIKISATSENRQRAFDIVSAVIEGYREQKKEDERRFFQETYKTFSKQLDVVHKNLLKAENTLAEFIVENEEIIEAMQNYGIPEKASKNFIAAALHERYLSAKADVSETQEFLKTIKKIASVDRLMALSTINKRYEGLVDLDLKKTLFEKEEELSRLLLVNEEAHPEVMRARGELGSIKKKIDTEIEDALNSIQSELDTLKEQEKGLAEFIASGLHEKMIAYNMLKRDIKVKRNIYNKLAEELQQINLGEKIKRYSEIRIIGNPKLPSTYSKRFPSRKILYGILMSIFCSLASIYVLETFDTSIKSIEQLEKLINLPVLATIPSYRKHKPGGEKG